MILKHISQDTGLVIVIASSPHLDLFGNGDLNMIDIVAVPNRLKNGVPKAEHQHILDRFFTEVVIDSVDLIFTKGLVDRFVELFCGRRIGAEWFLDNDSAIAIRIDVESSFS